MSSSARVFFLATVLALCASHSAWAQQRGRIKVVYPVYPVVYYPVVSWFPAGTQMWAGGYGYSGAVYGGAGVSGIGAVGGSGVGPGQMANSGNRRPAYRGPQVWYDGLRTRTGTPPPHFRGFPAKKR